MAFETKTVQVTDLKPGDVIVIYGNPHLIDSVRPAGRMIELTYTDNPMLRDMRYVYGDAEVMAS